MKTKQGVTLEELMANNNNSINSLVYTNDIFIVQIKSAFGEESVKAKPLNTFQSPLAISMCKVTA